MYKDKSDITEKNKIIVNRLPQKLKYVVFSPIIVLPLICMLGILTFVYIFILAIYYAYFGDSVISSCGCP